MKGWQLNAVAAMQTGQTFSMGGFTVSWTGMRVLKHHGSQHHGIGILPTVPAARTRKGVAEGKDEILLRGLEIVKAAGT